MRSAWVNANVLDVVYGSSPRNSKPTTNTDASSAQRKHMGINAWISRIDNNPARGVTAVLWFPFSLVSWLWVVLRNDPAQLLTPRPYVCAFAMFLIVVDGCFVGDPLD